MKTLIAFALLGLSAESHARMPEPTADFGLASTERPASIQELAGMAGGLLCSGGIVELVGQPANARAVLITNGHCASGALRANEAIVNTSNGSSFGVHTDSGQVVSVQAQRLLYATLTDTDLALFELKSTYAQLAAQGIRPFPLYVGEVPVGRALRLTSSYWSRTQECSFVRRVHKLLEGFGNDVSNPSVATRVLALSDRCLIRGGYSGTPVIDHATQSIIGLAFTVAEGGGRRCEERSPCEEDEAGNRRYVPRTSYAARVDQISTCLNRQGQLDFSLPGCTLFR